MTSTHGLLLLALVLGLLPSLLVRVHALQVEVLQHLVVRPLWPLV